MSIAETIEKKINDALDVQHFQLINDSHKHAGPATDSHFNLLIVSEGFTSLNQVKRHQLLYRVLNAELAAGIHALSLHLYTNAEWQQKKGGMPETPNCQSNNKS